MLFKKKKSFACVPRLPHFLAFSHFLSKHSPPGWLSFTRWCQESFQSILSQEAKATKRVRLRLLKAYQAQKRTTEDTGDRKNKSSQGTLDKILFNYAEPLLMCHKVKNKKKGDLPSYLNLHYKVVL